ncbi:Uncharacterised protein [Mycobacteroides abscessus]|nr:Uncharacterised protein [Mycobacteroides abscessus]
MRAPSTAEPYDSFGSDACSSQPTYPGSPSVQ